MSAIARLPVRLHGLLNAGSLVRRHSPNRQAQMPSSLPANRPASYSAEMVDPIDSGSALARSSQIRPVPLADGPALTADETKTLSPLRAVRRIAGIATPPIGR